MGISSRGKLSGTIAGDEKIKGSITMGKPSKGAKDAVVSFNQSLTKTCSLYYESDGQLVMSTLNSVTLNLKVGSILVYKSASRSGSVSPKESIVDVSGATYKNISSSIGYTYGTQNVRREVRFEYILFLITDTNVNIDIHS